MMENNVVQLLELIKNNPDLPIIPMVETEVVAGDEFGYWMGSFGDCDIKEYVLDDWYGEGIVRYRDKYTEEEVIEHIAESKYDGTEEGYKKAAEEIKGLWKKAIIVQINV